MADEPAPPAPRANKTYMVALSTTAAATIATAVLQFLGQSEVKDLRSKVDTFATSVTILQVQGAQQNQTLSDIRTALAPLVDGERERLKMEKVIRDLVKDEALKK